MPSEPEIARELLGNLRLMFLLERQFADKPRKQRERMRGSKVKAIVDRHFAYVGHCDHPVRCIVITEVGDQSRSEATYPRPFMLTS